MKNVKKSIEQNKSYQMMISYIDRKSIEFLTWIPLLIGFGILAFASYMAQLFDTTLSLRTTSFLMSIFCLLGSFVGFAHLVKKDSHSSGGFWAKLSRWMIILMFLIPGLYFFYAATFGVGI